MSPQCIKFVWGTAHGSFDACINYAFINYISYGKL